MGEFIQWDEAFSTAELSAIEKFCDGLISKVQPSGGRADAAWTRHASEAAWLYRRLEEIVLRMNAEFFRYELFGLAKRFQYAVYQVSQDGQSDWHKDHGTGRDEPSKISLILQLSGGDTYQGSDLELHADGHVQSAPRRRGTLIAFPSYVLHRVTPIRSGVRKSLVVWAAGPEFK